MHNIQIQGDISSDVRDSGDHPLFTATTSAVHTRIRDVHSITATIPVRTGGPVAAVGIDASSIARTDQSEQPQHTVSVTIFPRPEATGPLHDMLALEGSGIRIASEIYSSNISEARTNMLRTVGLQPFALGWELASTEQGSPQIQAVDVLLKLNEMSLPGQGQTVLPNQAYSTAVAIASAVTPLFLAEPIAEQDRHLNTLVASANSRPMPTAPKPKGPQVTAKGIGFDS